MQDLQTATNPSNPTTPKPPRSPAQIAASLANGKKSTGPTSPAGRQKCAYPATSRFKHHQLAETVLLTGESRPNFVALLESYIDTFQPLTEPEHNVIHQMVVAYWHKLRAWSTHQVAFNCEIARQDPSLPGPIKAAEAERVIHLHPKSIPLTANIATPCATSNYSATSAASPPDSPQSPSPSPPPSTPAKMEISTRSQASPME